MLSKSVSTGRKDYKTFFFSHFNWNINALARSPNSVVVTLDEVVENYNELSNCIG